MPKPCGGGSGRGDADEIAALAAVARRFPHQTEAFEQLARRMQPGLLRVCRRIVHDEALAEECAQEALVRAWLGINKLRDPARFAGWTRTIAVRLCLDTLRRREPEPPPPPEGGDDPELRLDLARALERLPPAARAAVSLRAEGASFAEIAASLGISESAAKMRVHRALRQLRDMLGD